MPADRPHYIQVPVPKDSFDEFCRLSGNPRGYAAQYLTRAFDRLLEELRKHTSLQVTETVKPTINLHAIAQRINSDD